jgi:hypothetical protein
MKSVQCQPLRIEYYPSQVLTQISCHQIKTLARFVKLL